MSGREFLRAFFDYSAIPATQPDSSFSDALLRSTLPSSAFAPGQLF